MIFAYSGFTSEYLEELIQARRSDNIALNDKAEAIRSAIDIMTMADLGYAYADLWKISVKIRNNLEQIRLAKERIELLSKSKGEMLCEEYSLAS